jgi:hypothetical protein
MLQQVQCTTCFQCVILCLFLMQIWLDTLAQQLMADNKLLLELA